MERTDQTLRLAISLSQKLTDKAPPDRRTLTGKGTYRVELAFPLSEASLGAKDATGELELATSSRLNPLAKSSTQACADTGACVAVAGPCQPASTNDCRFSRGRAKAGKCTFLGQACGTEAAPLRDTDGEDISDKQRKQIEDYLRSAE